MTYTVRQLTPTDAGNLRAIRLEALTVYPENYTATYATECQHDTAWFADLLTRETVFGAFDEEERLFATACLTPHTWDRNQHKATLRMVYVCAAWQGKGVARALIKAVLNYALTRFEQVLLSVESTNASAIHLYESLGFKTYGCEPHATKMPDGRYLDDVLMVAFRTH
jgi:ribosomal protein S18 acetylase RimI-like enzyme